MALWFYEEQAEGVRFNLSVRQTLHHEVSAYQDILVCDTAEFGRMLVLDGVIQLTEKDEFVYHELITQIPLHAHPHPENVLIIGGGDGGTVREVCKHPAVKHVVLAEIDDRVVQNAIDYLPFTSCALVNNPKLELMIGDGIKFVVDHPDTFDLIIVDSSDPIGPGEGLFTHAFYENVYKALKPDGMVVVQGETPWLDGPLVERICRDLQDIFPIAKAYWGNIPTYPSGTMLFPVGSKKYDPVQPVREPVAPFRYYNAAIHTASFALPEFLADFFR